MDVVYSQTPVDENSQVKCTKYCINEKRTASFIYGLTVFKV